MVTVTVTVMVGTVQQLCVGRCVAKCAALPCCFMRCLMYSVLSPASIVPSYRFLSTAIRRMSSFCCSSFTDADKGAPTSRPPTMPLRTGLRGPWRSTEAAAELSSSMRRGDTGCRAREGWLAVALVLGVSTFALLLPARGLRPPDRARGDAERARDDAARGEAARGDAASRGGGSCAAVA